jgi:hypothetical protein
MGRLILSLSLLLPVTATTVAEAHPGGLDRCSGHDDRKRGGYHVHDLARYCGGYPEAESCLYGPARSPWWLVYGSSPGGMELRARTGPARGCS